MPFIVRKQAKLSRGHATIMRATENALAREMADELRNIVPVDLGTGRDSIRADGKFVRAEAHIAYLDRGVRPGTAFPPPQKMEGWGRRVIGKSGLGWALSISIHRKGIRARKFTQKAMRTVFSRRKKNIERALAIGIQRAFH